MVVRHDTGHVVVSALQGPEHIGDAPVVVTSSVLEDGTLIVTVTVRTGKGESVEGCPESS